MNPVPLMVSVCAVEPAGSDAGSRGAVIVGTGLLGATTVKGIKFEFRPETPGLVTETWMVPAVATRAPGMVVDNCEEFCHAAGKEDVPKLIAAPGRKSQKRCEQHTSELQSLR